MYSKWLVLTTFLLLSGGAMAADQNEKQCTQWVDGVLQRLDILAKAGTEEKFQGLSAAEITAMRKAKGDCATQQELIRRVVVE